MKSFFRRWCFKRKRFNILRAVLGLVVLVWFGLAVNRVVKLELPEGVHIPGVSFFADVRPFIYQLKHTGGLPSCPLEPNTLRGRQDIIHEDNITKIIQNNSDVMTGGEWRPRDCVARKGVAVIIPYRDRSEHLVLLMANLHPMLQRQKLHYRFFLVEQLGTEEFNKGIIMNTAFTVANDTMDLDCLIFHDVDLVPMDDRNYYGCSDNPRHLSVAIDSFDFVLPYATLVGGVLGMRKEDFIELNGYSNMYWGWGAEDDDMYDRMVKHNLTLRRPNITVAGYHKVKHSNERRSDPGYNSRIHLLNAQHREDRSPTDGISSLTSRVVAIENHELYTRITVDVGKAPVRPKLHINFSFLFQVLKVALTGRL